jgi:hypothetical protein
MSKWKKFAQIERRIEASETFPPVSRKDKISIDSRGVIIKRYELGVDRLTDKKIDFIIENGYDQFILNQMNSLNKVGGKKFLKLIELEMIGLSFEHITFHNFREHLNKESRMKIASLLASHDPVNEISK